jgi:uncharacterized membrane protein
MSGVTSMNQPDTLALRQRDLNALLERGDLDAAAWSSAMQLAGLRPGTSAWRRFLDRLFLLGGALLLAAAVIFFIAYNWHELGRVARFILLQALVAGAAAGALLLGVDTPKGRAALLAAVILVGPLLAYFGQTYQTGADPYQLFVSWALLALPWAFASRSAPSWAVLLVVANLAVGLWLGEAFRPLGPGFSGLTPYFGLLCLNVAALAACEAVPSLFGSGRWLARLAGTIAIGAATWLGFWLVLGLGSEGDALLGWAYPVAIGAGAWYFRRMRLDLYLLAVGALSAIAVVTAAIGRRVIDFGQGSGLMMLGLLVIALSALAAIWLKNLAHMAGDAR